MASIPRRRLARVADTFASPPDIVGTLTLGDIIYDVPDLLDIKDPINIDNLHFMLQKYLLGQDIFLVSQPGPYARRLALTFASLINSEYEYIALHRDVGETELKQGREIRAGGNLVYVDSPAVNAVKNGRILILEGIEKAERGIMPVLNNLLENREMNLDDGTHIIHPHRYSQLDTSTDDDGNIFIPAHRNFRVIAIAAPVPPFPGHPLDPPFRSRFQARFVDPVGSLLALCAPTENELPSLETRLRELILSTQYASESRDALSLVSKSALPPFPQTALQKLRALVTNFPPPDPISSSQLARLLVTIHPALALAPLQAWAILSRQTEEAGLGALASPNVSDGTGLLGYILSSITRLSPTTASATFTHTTLSSQTLTVPAGPADLLPFPLPPTLPLTVSDRFLGLLTSLVQAHALGWDISLIPPAMPATASSSTSTLVRIFGEILAYNAEVVHLYKELGGRELFMRRRILDGVESAWAGNLVHLSGLDVIGPTAGSLARLVQDREAELWAGKRIVAEASPDEVGLALRRTRQHVLCGSQPMEHEEEREILLTTGCDARIVTRMLAFSERYRASMSEDSVQKNRKLGTRSLVRVARRLAVDGSVVDGDGVGDLRAILSRTLLSEFLPAMERMNIQTMLDEVGIERVAPAYHPSSIVQDDTLVFPVRPSTSGGPSFPTNIPLFNSHVPYMDQFYDNSIQTELMRDIAVDLELLGEHVVLLGNQGVGKNKIVDRLCQLLGRPREYLQLHRDTTVNQLMFTTALENGVIKYTDSPLLRAIIYGRIIIIDEADKAPEHVVAIFRSLAGQSELTLSDGRRVRKTRARPTDIVVHPNFRLVLLANRPGYPFLGNHFLQVLGETFSAHSRSLLAQIAPEMDNDLIFRLVGAFHDLRQGYDSGSLNYPYSLRELINLPETIDQLAAILERHGLSVPHLGLDAAREAATKKIKDEGDHDDKEHSGGNRWAGGTGGRDTAGMGGRGGYKRIYKGGDIKQVSDALKEQVPDHIREKAREMALQELQRRFLAATQSHMVSLYDLLEHLAAKEEERVWVKRQTDGELDDSRLTEVTPKRIRFLFDLSASMYRFQYDGRLQRSIETGNLHVMLMETFDRLSRKEKYVWDTFNSSTHSSRPAEMKDRWKVVEKMNMIPQVCVRWAIILVLEAIEKSIKDIAAFDAGHFESWWVYMTFQDANFGRYLIKPEDIARAMNRNPKVHTALICIGEGAEATWIPTVIPGRGFRLTNTADIPTVLRSILSTMVDR
ncbi:AAA domain-containing protein [Mycena amicta]|nr:AAA domain-containing protein [Mycena amicta]